MGWGLIIALFLSILVAAVIFHLIRRIAPLLLHGIIGIAFFWLLSNFGLLRVPIDIVTFLIAAFGGIFGVLIVVALSFLGVPL